MIWKRDALSFATRTSEPPRPADRRSAVNSAGAEVKADAVAGGLYAGFASKPFSTSSR